MCEGRHVQPRSTSGDTEDVPLVDFLLMEVSPPVFRSRVPFQVVRDARTNKVSLESEGRCGSVWVQGELCRGPPTVSSGSRLKTVFGVKSGTLCHSCVRVPRKAGGRCSTWGHLGRDGRLDTEGLRNSDRLPQRTGFHKDREPGRVLDDLTALM